MEKTTNTLYLDSTTNAGIDLSLAPTTNGITHLIGTLDDFIERGSASTNSSNISYKIEGTTGARIAKIQGKNLGFWGELDNYGTLNDSTNIQIWIYEDSNNIEFHWGASSITSNYNDIFSFGLPLASIVKNFDGISFNFDYIYYTDQSTGNINIDSITFAQMQSLQNPIGINNYPTNGTVFRFATPTSSVNGGIQLNNYARIYPTLVKEQLYIDINQPNFIGVASIVDMNGKIAVAQHIGNGNNILNTSTLASGNYVVNIRSAKESVFYKITK